MLKHKHNADGAFCKLRVGQFTHTCGNSWRTAAEFIISEKKQLDTGPNLPTDLLEIPCTKKDERGFKPSFPKEELNSWLLNLRQDDYIITRTTMLREHTNFKASAGCCTHFMCHNKQKASC